VDIETVVTNFGETYKNDLMDLYYDEMLAVDGRYECMLGLANDLDDGLDNNQGYECFVDNVSPLVQLPGPLNTPYIFKIMDYTFERSSE
jgi:hypothetical protein